MTNTPTRSYRVRLDTTASVDVWVAATDEEEAVQQARVIADGIVGEVTRTASDGQVLSIDVEDRDWEMLEWQVSD